MRAAVVGLGTVGETLAEVLLALHSELPLDELIVVRRAVPPWDEPRIQAWSARGVTIATRADGDGYEDAEDALRRAQFVFDCGPNGYATARKAEYDALPELVGALAQGSEPEFGPPFMTGVPHARIEGARFVHVVSCNTHGIASVLQALGGECLDGIESADFVVVRRSEDLGKAERLVGATVVARHRDPKRGTHHAHDVARLFDEIGVERTLISSDVTTPSQLLHALRFRVTTCGSVDAAKSFASRPWIATTARFDSDAVFERGRRSGFQGRIWAHAVVVSNNLIRTERDVIGWAFVPQESNSIPSTVHAFLLQTGIADPDVVMARLRDLVFVPAV